MTFNVGGTVTTTAATLGWLTLTNGTFDWASTQSTSLSTTSFTIPPTARLRVSAGTVNTTSGDNDAYDLFLSGALDVSGTGNVNVGNATVNGNNVDIEYASAGVPAISVSTSGTLWVKSSVRRSTTTITGALSYSQTSGTVTVGGISSTENNTRGVFEIDANTGSSFTMTGTSTLNIERQTGGAGYTDLLINPLTSSVSPTSTITVGLTTATTQNNLRISVLPTIGNFTVQNGATTNAQTVNMFSNPLIVSGNLTIPTPSVLVTNSLDVTIAGNLVLTGTYTGGTNTTTFNGTGPQTASLSGTSTFNNMTVSKAGGTTLGLSGTAPTLNNLNILSGILNVGALALPVRRDIVINSSQIGGGSIVVFSTNGNSNSITSSGGSFTNLTLAGTATTKTVNVTGNLTINGTLNFGAASRFLMIASNQLTFGVSAPAVTGAGATAFIRTNGVSSDLGVTKIWGTGTNTFIYPVGTASNYTPVSYSLNVTGQGNLTVSPVNSAHVTYNQASGEQILNYYWNVDRESSLLATASGSHTYSYPASLFTGTGGSLVAGYLNVGNPVGWTTTGHGGSATTTLMTFTTTPATNLPPAGGSYDYSVGTSNTLPNPIVPLYSRIGIAAVANLNAGGNWNTAANWTPDADGDPDLNNPSGFAPSGVPVVILSGTRINMTSNGRRAYSAVINGILDNGVRTGHNLGVISGTGIFRTATNTFPAGDYTAFVAATGGTVEYVAPMTMNNRTVYNNLSIYSASAGTVTMTASNLTVNGNVTIPAGTTLSNSTNNADMNVARNWINNGTFDAGTGTATVTFNGTVDQTITGATTFNGLGVNKTGGNLLPGVATTVNGPLVMTDGNIISSTFPAAPLLILGSSATLTGGSSDSFVSGQIRKNMNLGSTFTYPTGSNSASRYRPVTVTATSATDTWDISYIPNNPTDDGFPNTSFNAANMVEVSQHEYWLVANGTGTTSAGVTLSFGPGSYGTPGDAGILSSLKVVRWGGTEWDIPPGGGTFSQSGNSIAGTVSVSLQTSFSPLTLGTDDLASALPIELVYFKADPAGSSVVLSWKTASELRNDYFTVERSATGETFTNIGEVKGAGTTSQEHTYGLVDVEPLMGTSYYRLRQTDFNGDVSFSKIIPVTFDGSSSPIVMKVYPNPSKGNELTIEFEGLEEDKMPVMMYDQLGREFAQFELESDGNKRMKKTFVFEKPLMKGMYILKAGSTPHLIKRLIVVN